MKKYTSIFIAQAALLFFAAFIVYLLRPAGILFAILYYAVFPLMSGYASYKIVRRGINAYLAWILPPVAQSLAGFLASMGFSPDLIGILITAIVSLVASAAGDVKNKQKKRR